MYPSHLGTSYKIPLRQNADCCMRNATVCSYDTHKSNTAGKSQIATRRFSGTTPSMRAAFIPILDAKGPISVIIIMMDVRSNISASSTPFFDRPHSHYVITIHLCHLQVNCGQIQRFRPPKQNLFWNLAAGPIFQRI